MRMLAISTISTMKVDAPRERSSADPIRVKIRSHTPTLAEATTKGDLCEQDDQGGLPDGRRLARHVRAGDDVDAALLAVEEVPLGTKVTSVCVASTTG